MVEPGIVTPEAVVLSFETAGVGSRVVAMSIDLAIQLAAVGIVLLGSSLLSGTPIGWAPAYFGIFLIAFGYPIGLETLWRGRTVGKAAMGLRVVTIEGAPIRFRHALVRGALGLIDFWFTLGAAGVLCILMTKRNQRLGDLAAGTLVLRERTGARAVAAATFWIPPGWEAYAATLDVNGITAADYQAIRSFLLRAGTLDPWTRDRVAREIATAVLPRLHHQPPPGVSAEILLLCVAALYQARQRRVPAAPPAWGAPSPPAPSPYSAPAVPLAATDAAPTWAYQAAPAPSPPVSGPSAPPAPSAPSPPPPPSSPARTDGPFQAPD
jgi:uncharacterized RDD family membrane protein YckC